MSGTLKPEPILAIPKEYLEVLPDPEEGLTITDVIEASETSEFTFIDEMPDEEFLKSPLATHCG